MVIFEVYGMVTKLDFILYIFLYKRKINLFLQLFTNRTAVRSRSFIFANVLITIIINEITQTFYNLCQTPKNID